MSLFSLAAQASKPKSSPQSQAKHDPPHQPPDGPTYGAGVNPPAAAASALQRLVDFIPIETITLWWLAIPAADAFWGWMNTSTKDIHHPTELDYYIYFFLIFLTPIFLLLAYLGLQRRNRAPLWEVRSWPWWKALAATIAFSVWALAVPGNPFFHETAILMAIWVGATVVSTLLVLIDAIVSPPPD